MTKTFKTFEEWRDYQGFPVTSTQEPLWRECWEVATLAAREQCAKVAAQPQPEPEQFKEALHRISLCSQNSASSKEECGRIARAVLKAQKEKT